jgi:hypothetical protein
VTEAQVKEYVDLRRERLKSLGSTLSSLYINLWRTFTGYTGKPGLIPIYTGTITNPVFKDNLLLQSMVYVTNGGIKN